MEIVTFELSNYRSIQRTERLALGNPTVIVGPNNEGKSNIIRALVTCVRFLCSSPRESLLTRSWGYEWSRDFPIALQEKNPSGESLFHVEFQLDVKERASFLKTVGSKNNGKLKIEISLGNESPPKFNVLKQGGGKEAMNRRSHKIREFLRNHLRIEHIPAVRTADEARRVIHQLIQDDLAQIESSEEYKDAMRAIGALQKPIFDRLGRSLTASLRAFLPDIKAVKISAGLEARQRALRSSYDINIDDGTATALDKKGDGVQSLAALALMKHAVTPQLGDVSLVLAIEEPESHLHPSAIHRLQEVISDLSKEHQVIISTHCPLFVDRKDVSKNIIVNKKRARASRSVNEVREALGVRVSDNLTNAEIVLIVEGETDRHLLSAIMRSSSATVGRALDSGIFAIDSLAGASNLTYKLQLLRDSMCQCLVLLDKDKAGDEAKKKAIEVGVLTPADAFQLSRPGAKESELEDFVDEGLYVQLLREYGVDMSKPSGKEAKQKWSDRLMALAERQAHPLSEVDLMSIKIKVAALVQASPGSALKAWLREPINSVISAIEGRLAMRG
ncbi:MULTISPECIES: ATP-dependent nuclease [Stenotrophomonas]|uniref:ATP-dependent nuclease n=1 Tax=Stenotrophomonas TaxID=40323 RepID=UPI0024029EF1|nr:MULTISPECIES: AAA family ATPase [Stenotrophomonas]MDH0170952.1 AAA family ATPase [Stenotrophomonas sp. GD04145]